MHGIRLWSALGQQIHNGKDIFHALARVLALENLRNFRNFQIAPVLLKIILFDHFAEISGVSDPHEGS